MALCDCVPLGAYFFTKNPTGVLDKSFSKLIIIYVIC